MERDRSKDKAQVAKEKTKARRSGPSLLGKTIELGIKADTLTAALYWEPTHKEFRTAAHIPEGFVIPDANSLIAAAVSRPAQTESPRRQKKQQARQQRKPQSQPSGRSAYRVEKPAARQQALRRSARQRARLHASQSPNSDPYEFTGADTPEPGTQQPDQNAGLRSGAPGSPTVEGTGSNPTEVRPAEDSGRVAVDGGLVGPEGPGDEAVPLSEGPRTAQETVEEIEAERRVENAHSEAPRDGDPEAVAHALANIVGTPEGSFGVYSLPQNLSSPFGSSSWMDMDFLGGLPHDAEFSSQELQGLQQESGMPQPVESQLQVTTAPRQVPTTAWWALAKESLDLLKKMMSAQKGFCEAGPY